MAILDPISTSIAMIIGYLIGSIPFGFIITRIAGLGDIRKIGSGNIGATNVLRTGKKGLAALTLLLDSGKGALAIFIVSCIFGFLPFIAMPDGSSVDPLPGTLLLVGLCAVFGHVFPVWLKFKGGKGVATALGTLLALAPWVGAGACLIWLIMALILRYSSLAALAALLATPLLAHVMYHDADLAGVCGIIALLVWFRHRANIKRLLAGEEPKIGRKKEAV